ncbi:alpha/beta fold hydrolase [Tsukamurella ocularis]|uniref:alpha/beta fold hydrolase n=1 Tax=Tsukamurella ocularis TaxID=1970234 RepID=UPI0039F096EC
MRTTKIRDVVLGDLNGTPVLLIHGFTVDHRLLLPLDAAFAQSGRRWRRHYIDLPGFGASPAGPEIDGVDALARAVERYVDDRLGDAPFAVVGNSLGGALARHLACSRPDRILGLCLLVPSVVPLPERSRPAPTRFDVDAELLAYLSPDDRAAYEDMAVDLTAENWERYRSSALPGIRAHDRVAAERIWADFSLSVEPESLLAAPMTAPSLLVTARQDAVVGYEDQLRLIAHYARMAVVIADRAGHNVHIDRPEVVRAAMTDWVDRMMHEERAQPRM